jgi:uncharacterized protein YigA (DUF484 family)
MSDKTEHDADFEAEIVDYLHNHSDFFSRHPELLQMLNVPHSAGEGTISLVERQTQLLRDKAGEYRKQLEQLIAVARENDDLNRRLHELTLTLIETDELDRLMDILLDDLREQFNADAVELKLFSAENLEQAVNERQAVPLMFDDFMKQGKPRCGALKKEQLQYLFGNMAAETGSVALIPLTHNAVEGVLAIGSRDAQRFHPGKDTEFLQRLGDLVSHALGRIKPLEQE